MAKIKKKIFSVLAPLMLGLSVGAAGLNTYLGYQIDELHFRLKTLEEQLASSQSEIEQLKTSLAGEKHPVLSSINVYVTVKSVQDDKLTKLEHEQIKIETVKDVRKRLTTLLGQEMSKINFQQLALIIDGREININKRTFIQKVNLLIVKENLDIYMTLQPKKPAAANILQ